MYQIHLKFPVNAPAMQHNVILKIQDMPDTKRNYCETIISVLWRWIKYITVSQIDYI